MASGGYWVCGTENVSHSLLCRSHGINRLLVLSPSVLLSEGSITLGPSLPLVVVIGVTFTFWRWVEAHEMLGMGLPVLLSWGPGDIGPVGASG